MPFQKVFRRVIILVTVVCLLPIPARAEGEGEDTSHWSVARHWNEATLYSIRRDLARPVVHARNLWHTSIAMWDIWAAFDPDAEGFLFHEKFVTSDENAAREEAMSYACYRILRHRFANSPGAEVVLPHYDDLMNDLGYDTGITTTEGGTAAALGNRVAEMILTWGMGDGANEENNYEATNGYEPVNEPLVVALTGNPDITDPNRWQPLALEFFVGQSGIIIGEYPDFLGPHWTSVTPFALRERDRSPNTHFDPGPPPLLGTATDQEYKDGFTTVIYYSSRLDPDSGETIDVSPAGQGNNTLGLNDGTGYPMNPYTGMPYDEFVVPVGDWGRVIAEFWADGPDSETPPGHWNTVANYVSDHPLLEKRYMGEGPVLDDLQWDCKLYFALNGANHDAAVAAWGAKGHYDYIRPISAIRYMCGQGQSSEPEAADYDPNGIPLIPGLIERITVETTASGQRHEELAGEEGSIAIRAWPGEPEDIENDYSGVRWMLCEDWVPYQRSSFVTPPFAAYVSGHSTYSRASAEVLTLLTGDEYFPGGLGTWPAPQDDFLFFEKGPSVYVEMQWAKYYDASDESGLSRLYGGIHVPADDGPGRIMGAKVGKQAFWEAHEYFTGVASCHDIDTTLDHTVDLSELLRLIQMFQFGEYHCSDSTEDGFDLGPGDQECIPHDVDYDSKNWTLSLSEILRGVQLYNSDGYTYCPERNTPTEDGFCV